MAIPKGLEPTGVILVDKPAGPSSFAVLAGVRSRTGAKTGHAGTLDPFATGLLILLSGRATTMASCFVGLPKRYLTDVDLSRRTTTGDPEGELLELHDVPASDALETRSRASAATIELPIPTASAVKIGGERAYKLHRKGVVVEMPLRRSRVDALDVIAYTGRHRDTRSARQLRDIRPVDRRCARRSLRLAAADGGRAVLRRGGRRRVRPLARRGARSNRDDRRGGGGRAPQKATPTGGRRRAKARILIGRRT